VDMGINIQGGKKYCGGHTVHELLFFKCNREARLIPLEMQCEDMEPRTSIVAFHGDRPRIMLHCEIIPDGS
jgi:hypothetical protein